MEMGQQLHVAAATGCLKRIAAVHANAALASSFGLEDMVITDLIVRHSLPIAVFSLDTGRLPHETYALIDRVRDHYGIDVELYLSDTRSLEAYVREHGVNAFYRSVELRQRCCAIRKTEPLARALIGRDAWITGQRRSQSVTRATLATEELDTVHHADKGDRRNSNRRPAQGTKTHALPKTSALLGCQMSGPFVLSPRVTNPDLAVPPVIRWMTWSPAGKP